MRVVFLTEGTPSTQSVVHRVIYAQQSLLSRGCKADILYGTSGALLGHTFQRVKLTSILRGLLTIEETDALVVHRAADPLTGLFSSISKRRGVPLVFDLDDAIYLRPNALSMLASYLISRSDAVIAGSHALAEHCARLSRNVNLIPGQVDTRLFSPVGSETHGDIPTIGWMGDGRVHAANLEMLVAPLVRLAARTKFKLKLVSALRNPRITSAFRLLERYIDVDYGSPDWVDIAQIPAQMAEFDVSVMPLLDTEFNRGKAGQKLLESMAMEIPVVASPVGENSYIVSHGVDGFLAPSADEWTDFLEILIRDPPLRQRMGKRGRQKVLEAYSREVCSGLFARALGSAVNNAQRRRA